MGETDLLGCHVTVAGNSPHVHQVVAGFALLAARGELDATFTVVPPDRAPLGSPHVVLATVGGRRVAYDMLDGYTLAPERLERAVAAVDVYFKRSFSRARSSRIPNGERIQPFGLNYQVKCKCEVFRRMAACDPLRQRVGRLGKSILGRSGILAPQTFEGPPVARDAPRAIFMSRVYDPSGEPGEDRSALTREVAAERDELNRSRVACLRALRDALGPRFVGGLVPTPYARDRYPDCILRHAEVARPRFLRSLRTSDVGVATTGLHGSIQWKFPEYLAASKAIVSEPLRYEVPALRSPENYLTFETPEQCVAQVTRLLDDPRKRLAMMQANHDYYEAYVRPDSAVARTIRIVTEPQQERRP